MSAARKFVDLVGERFGNPNAEFAGGSLKARQSVMVMLHGKEIIVPATVISRNKKKSGYYFVRYHDPNGRSWRLSMKKRDILVKW